MEMSEGGIVSSVGGLPFVLCFLDPQPPLFPPAAETTQKGVEWKVSRSHIGEQSYERMSCRRAISLLHLFRSAAAKPKTLHFPTTGETQTWTLSRFIVLCSNCAMLCFFFFLKRRAEQSKRDRNASDLKRFFSLCEIKQTEKAKKGQNVQILLRGSRWN